MIVKKLVFILTTRF